ncbi:MAG: MBL fold metallo-hydrolase, partial [Paludibacteraceae bacterium]|nr:MBL fold metallo-hydrolase [Paludibacteraceae bacterium]
FNSLKYIENVAESKALNTDPFPSIIISASGMLEAGRVKHHVANHISDPSTTVMIVGYCTPSSLGARIQRPGLRQISIFGDMYDIRARITKLEGFSGHGDYQEMIDFLSCQDKGSIKKVFLVHGEKQYQDQYRQHMEEAGFHDVEIPEPQSVYEL